jgi:hypothetical protein
MAGKLNKEPVKKLELNKNSVVSMGDYDPTLKLTITHTGYQGIGIPNTIIKTK